MKKKGIGRVTLTFILVLPAAFAIHFIVYVVLCIMIGPWGAVLEVPPGHTRFQFNKYLQYLLSALLIVGPIVIAWSWAGRILTMRERRASERHKANHPA